MVRKIVYNVRFPFGGVFYKDPKYILLKNIYKMIKKTSVLTENEGISIYKIISGEVFIKYPSIIVSRDFFEKTNFKKNEIMNITFYIIGDFEIYSGFVTEYFNSFEYIGNVYFQKQIVTNELINDYELYNGKIILDTPIISVEDIINCINYYNTTYKTKFPIPKIDVLEKTNVNDYNPYLLDNKAYRISGFKGILNVVNYPKVFLETGIGIYSVLGGGKGHAY